MKPGMSRALLLLTILLFASPVMAETDDGDYNIQTDVLIKTHDGALISGIKLSRKDLLKPAPCN
jgi:hypothetical protein